MALTSATTRALTKTARGADGPLLPIGRVVKST